MIKRELYMRRIRPFMGNELIKVLTGIRRSGKSVMLDLIKEELLAFGVDGSQFISLNFENMSNAHLCTAQALHDEILRRASAIQGKVYLFFDEIQEVDAWEKCINSGRYVEFVIYPFSFGEFVDLYKTVYPDADSRQCFNQYLTMGGMPYLANLR